MNLIEGLQKEAERRREAKKEYESLPDDVGKFGAIMLQQDIERIDKTIASGDTVQMLGVYKEMSEADIE